MTKKKKPKPLSDKAYEFIRQQIVKGVFSQGSRLVVNSLARELDLSSTPVNEALAALEREGLVVASQYKGYKVCTLSASDVEDLYAVREAIEALVVRLAMKRDRSALVSQLRDILEEESKAIEDMDFTRFGELDYAFHSVVWDIGNNIYANRFEKVINGHVHLILAAAAKTAGRFHSAHNEHIAIVEQIARGDVPASEAAMRVHIHNAGIAMKKAFESIQSNEQVRTDS